MEHFKSQLLKSIQYCLEDLYNLSEPEAKNDTIEVYETMREVMESHQVVFYMP
jgi:hypothetical protein